LENVEGSVVSIHMNLRKANPRSHPLASFKKIPKPIQIAPASRKRKKTDSLVDTIWYQGMINLK
jgi:hypothetical protein